MTTRELQRLPRSLAPCERLAGERTAPSERRPVQLERRARIAALLLDRLRRPFRRNRQPWLRLREAVARLLGFPRDRHPAAVTSLPDAARAEEDRVLPELVGELDLLEAQLLTRVEKGRPRQREQQERGRAGPPLAPEAGAQPRHVVALEHP